MSSSVDCSASEWSTCGNQPKSASSAHTNDHFGPPQASPHPAHAALLLAVALATRVAGRSLGLLRQSGLFLRSWESVRSVRAVHPLSRCIGHRIAGEPSPPPQQAVASASARTWSLKRSTRMLKQMGMNSL